MRLTPLFVRFIINIRIKRKTPEVNVVCSVWAKAEGGSNPCDDGGISLNNKSLRREKGVEGSGKKTLGRTNRNRNGGIVDKHFVKVKANRRRETMNRNAMADEGKTLFLKAPLQTRDV